MLLSWSWMSCLELAILHKSLFKGFHINRVITHNKLPQIQCYHTFSTSRVVYLAKNHYENYSPQMVPTNPTGSWTVLVRRWWCCALIGWDVAAWFALVQWALALCEMWRAHEPKGPVDRSSCRTSEFLPHWSKQGKNIHGICVFIVRMSCYTALCIILTRRVRYFVFLLIINELYLRCSSSLWE